MVFQLQTPFYGLNCKPWILQRSRSHDSGWCPYWDCRQFSGRAIVKLSISKCMERRELGLLSSAHPLFHTPRHTRACWAYTAAVVIAIPPTVPLLLRWNAYPARIGISPKQKRRGFWDSYHRCGCVGPTSMYVVQHVKERMQTRLLFSNSSFPCNLYSNTIIISSLLHFTDDTDMKD